MMTTFAFGWSIIVLVNQGFHSISLIKKLSKNDPTQLFISHFRPLVQVYFLLALNSSNSNISAFASSYIPCLASSAAAFEYPRICKCAAIEEYRPDNGLKNKFPKIAVIRPILLNYHLYFANEFFQMTYPHERLPRCLRVKYRYRLVHG